MRIWYCASVHLVTLVISHSDSLSQIQEHCVIVVLSFRCDHLDLVYLPSPYSGGLWAWISGSGSGLGAGPGRGVPWVRFSVSGSGLVLISGSLGLGLVWVLVLISGSLGL